MTDYNTDFVLWAEEQAAKLRAGRLTDLDQENIAEELASIAGALRRELVERLARLLQNLLQWEYLDGLRLPLWYNAIQEERSMIPPLLEDAPSLAQNWPEAYVQAWDIARERACNITGIAAVALPQACPYSRECALAVTFWPGRGDDAPLKIDEETVDRAAHDNPDLPRTFMAETLNGLVEVREAFQRMQKISPEVGERFKADIRDLGFYAWPDMRTVTLGVDSRDVASSRFVSAMKGSAQGAFVTFETPELLFQVLTSQRWTIIKAVIGTGLVSIEEIARRVGRDVEVVHDDVRALLDAGVLERTTEGAIVFPYDAVHVDFILT
jgi:predicted transcriptional regulator